MTYRALNKVRLRLLVNNQDRDLVAYAARKQIPFLSVNTLERSAMKRQFVESLREGDSVNDYFVALRKDVRTQQNGSKFLGMVFKDRTGEIGGILWNNAVAVARLFEVGDVVKVRGTVVSYQDRLQIRVDQVLPLRQNEYDPADLTYLPTNSEKVSQEFVERVRAIENEWLKRLTGAFLDNEEFMRRFLRAAAGKKWHHAYPGGLVQHCWEMAQIADGVCQLFRSLDRDLLLSAIFLHDVGKLAEMSQELVNDYTTEGRLLGHVTLGATSVQRAIDKIDGFPNTLRLQLLHCILSHHGTLENGSPVLPKTLEAVVLHFIDNLDAQADAITRVIEETRARGESWSEYIAQIERQVWTKESP